MALAFYQEKNTSSAFSDPLRSFHHGPMGSVHEEIVYIHNTDSSKYYSNVLLTFEVTDYDDWGELGATGWGVKLMYGERRPTEAEWNLVRSGEGIQLPDIGESWSADTGTYHPVWIRIVSPANEVAQIRSGQQLKLTALEHPVGA